MLGKMRRHLFGISADETSVVKRGFSVSDPNVQERLETIGSAFVCGYHAALLHPQPGPLAAELDKIEPELCGFAYEGAGMGLTLLDLLLPWPSQNLLNFLRGPGQAHRYMVQIGVGWALARLQRPVDGWLQRLEPVVGWLLTDGYGFHETYFSWSRVVNEQAVPKQLSGYACRGFDQGVGRALWFVKGADVDRIAAAIGAFPEQRAHDLWSGVGLASAYAGGVSCSVLENLLDAAGPDYAGPLAQGVVFAAKARLHAGNPAPHTEMACQLICGLNLAEAGLLFDRMGQNLPPPEEPGDAPAFEVWRQRIQQHFCSHLAGSPL